MLDTMTAIAAATPWTQTLQRGDVVLFNFPCADDGPVKARPCLVLEVGRVGDHAFAEIAYGTTATGKANKGWEIHINQRAGMAMAGLDQPTRFVGFRRVTVTLDSTLFRIPRGRKSPIIGRLDDAGLERMNAVCARIWANRGMAAERRNERRGVTDQGVPVIWRGGASKLSATSKGAA
ncbi:hypothetical protein [Rubrimonas cliftonensis]|uniref:Type II toxin-antitoxin system PemK/MazF family toxin n=1 Tax=Rubrimonas cliftonensis TaxID=89524 RepID=A0A1H4FXZ3_9RHOB|nr:hypothetical protein [Rubrimonas cliftonensis]SEB02185.1 hypothetical protein SAMN05444370_13112 [Rubrimonas cliftonensis]